MYKNIVLSSAGTPLPEDFTASLPKGEAHIFIGIGGIGVRALSEIKRAVYAHIRSEEGDDAYSRVKFLAVDSDQYAFRVPAAEMSDLQMSECFSIAQPNLNIIMRNPSRIRMMPNMDWMDPKSVVMFGTEGSGGSRQAGRFCLMMKAGDLHEVIQQRISDVKAAAKAAAVKIHIIAGLGGGTGGGCFVDVCYIVRSALAQTGTAGRLYGYFFRPDVLLCEMGIAGNWGLEQCLKANGAASLLELMRLRENGWVFEQNYGDFGVKTQEPPVDECRLISAVDADGVIIPNAYECGMRWMREYAVSLLSGREF